jgi:hypothetical protein
VQRVQARRAPRAIEGALFLSPHITYDEKAAAAHRLPSEVRHPFPAFDSNKR